MELLLQLADARQASVSKPMLRVYVEDLAAHDMRDVEAAVARLRTSPKEKFETGFPQLGTIIARVKEARQERMTPPKLGACETCEGRRIVMVEREGRRFARDCKCIVDWRRLRDELAQGAAA